MTAGSVRSRVARSLATTALAEVVNKLSPLVILYYAQMHLGVTGFGLAQYAMVFLEVFLPFVAFGYGTLGAIEIGRLRHDPAGARAVISGILVLRLLHLLSIAVIVSILILQPAFDDSRPVIFAISFMLLASCIETDFAHYGTQTVALRNMITSAAKLTGVAGVWLFVRDPGDIIIYAVLACLPQLAIAAGSAWFNIRKFPLQSPSRAQCLELFRKAVPFAIVGILLTAGERFDMLIAEHFFGKEGAGLYGGQMRLMQSIASGISAIGVVFFSELLVPQTPERFTRTAGTGLFVMSLVTAPVAAGVFFVDRQLVNLIYGPAFVPDARVLSLLMLGTVFAAGMQVFGVQVLLIRQRLRRFNMVMTAATVAGGGVAFALAPAWGLIGIATGALCSRLIAAAGFYLGARDLLAGLAWIPVLKSCTAALMMAAVLSAIGRDHLWINLAVGAGVYIAAVLALNRHELSGLLGQLRSRITSNQPASPENADG